MTGRLVLSVAFLLGCGGANVQRISGIEARIAADPDFGRYAPGDQQLIRGGRVRVGLDERAMWVAHGTPTFYWQSNVDGKWCRVFAYGLANPAAIDTAIYTCNGQVRYISVVQPTLPCGRILAAGRRAVERAGYFDMLPLERQWQLLAGILERGQTSQDLYIAFGAPYNTGTEAREDGTNAMEQVFLDLAQDAYALYVTLVDDRVVAWRFPAERMLTPEAQQRRLDAAEQRLMAQMQQAEAQSIRQHQEEQAALGHIQANQGQLIDQVAGQPRRSISGNAAGPAPPPTPPPPTTPPAAPAQAAPPVQHGGSSSNDRRCSQTLTIDGCAYTDLGDCLMGTACENDWACASGYTCTRLEGTYARCMPPPRCD